MNSSTFNTKCYRWFCSFWAFCAFADWVPGTTRYQHDGYNM